MAIIKGKKGKKWCSIISKDFRGQILGETLAYSEKDLVGRKLEYNLMNLTGDPKKQNAKLVFKINNFVQDKANTEIEAYYLVNAYIKRLMKKGINKVEDSLILKGKDCNLRVKPFLLTKNKVSKSIVKSIRKDMKEFLNKEMEKQSFLDIINNVISNKIQRSLREKLNKIYPLIVCEFRRLERVK